MSIAPELANSLRFPTHDFKGGQYRGHIGGAHAGAEYKGARMVLQEVDGLRVGTDKASQTRQRLAKGPHDQVDLIGEIEMTGRAGTLLTKHAYSVGIIDHHCRAILSSNFAKLRQLDDIAFHAKDAVDDYELTGRRLKLFQTCLQRGQILMWESEKLALSQKTALNDAGVIAFVTDHILAFAYQCADYPKIDLEAGAVEQNRLVVNQLCQFIFEFQMNVQRSVEKA